jgi:hypothetical protein
MPMRMCLGPILIRIIEALKGKLYHLAIDHGIALSV